MPVILRKYDTCLICHKSSADFSIDVNVSWCTSLYIYKFHTVCFLQYSGLKKVYYDMPWLSIMGDDWCLSENHSVLDPAGIQRFYHKNNLHSDVGPAVLYPNGATEYYRNGYNLSRLDWERYRKK